MSGGRAESVRPGHIVGQGLPCLRFYTPDTGICAYEIHAHCRQLQLVTRLSTHRRVVALDSTDFTDVAAVVISAADSRSGILTLLRRSGFNLPVYLLSETAVDKPEGAGGDRR